MGLLECMEQPYLLARRRLYEIVGMDVLQRELQPVLEKDDTTVRDIHESFLRLAGRAALADYYTALSRALLVGESTAARWTSLNKILLEMNMHMTQQSEDTQTRMQSVISVQARGSGDVRLLLEWCFH